MRSALTRLKHGGPRASNQVLPLYTTILTILTTLTIRFQPGASKLNRTDMFFGDLREISEADLQASSI